MALMDWIPPTAGFSILSAVASWLITTALKSEKKEAAAEGDLKLNQERDASLRDDIRALRSELRDVVLQLREVTAQHVTLQSSQNVVNEGTAMAIRSIVATAERTSDKVADQGMKLAVAIDAIGRLDRGGLARA